MNPLSLLKLVYRSFFYDALIKEMSNDRNAFLRRQAEWLGVPFDSIDMTYCGLSEEEINQHRNEIKQIVRKYISYNPFDSEKNKELKNELCKPVVALLVEEDEKTWKTTWKATIADFGKGTQTISSKRFNSIMKSEIINLPYEMKGPYNTGIYRIQEKN